MLYCDRIYFSEGIVFDKTSESRKCDICHYFYFLDKGCRFQPDVSNGCHDVLKISMNLSDIAILNIQGGDCRYIIRGFSKREAINIMQNVDLSEKSETLQIIKIIQNFKKIFENG